MGAPRSDFALSKLWQQARQQAKQRREHPTTVHLLAALIRSGGAAAELLARRRIDEQMVLDQGELAEDVADGIAVALDNAVALAQRSVVQRPSESAAANSAAVPVKGAHLLLTLLSNRHFAAYRALRACGLDIARLRTAVTGVAIGAVVPPRATSKAAAHVASRRPMGAVRPPRRPRAAHQARAEAPPAPARSMPERAEPLLQTEPQPATGDAYLVSAHCSEESLHEASPNSSAEEAPAALQETASAPAEPSRPAWPVPLPLPVEQETAPDEPSRPARPVPLPLPVEPETALAEPDRPARPVPLLPVEQETDELAAFRLDPTEAPELCALGRNLTLAAAMGAVDPAVGRQEELEEALDVLAQKRRSNPLFVGPRGVGKTTLAHGIAAYFAQQQAQDPRLLVELPAGELSAAHRTVGALGDRIAAACGESLQTGRRVVLFVDDVHELLLGGAAQELLSEMATGMERGEISVIGTTTGAGYRQLNESSPSLTRHFTVINVAEPTQQEAVKLLRAVAGGLGEHHQLHYPDETLEAAVSWSVQYLPGRALPDKAVAILDLAGARAKRRKSRGIRRQPARRPPPGATVKLRHVAEVVAKLTDTPLERLLQTDQERMLQLEEILGASVVGHRDALRRIATVLRRNAAGLHGPRPIGTFLLLGPTGVGKTETAKAIARALFHSAEAITRLDMSEYSEAHAVARLVGAPPGYVGHEAGGALTEALQRRPYQVVLLDEIEKAHRDVQQTFLQVFDEGHLTDGCGRRVDFKNAVLVLTSNLGSAEMSAAQTTRPVGFRRRGEAAHQTVALQDAAVRAARAALPPELYNRIDEVIVFAPLSRHHVAQIASQLLAALAESLLPKGIRLTVDDEVIEALLSGGGYEPELGARPMRRAIARRIEAPLADLILRGELPKGSTAQVSVEGDHIVIKPRATGRASATAAHHHAGTAP